MIIHSRSRWNLFNCKIIVFGIYYLLKLRLKTRANLSQHCPTADCYFQIYAVVSQAIATFGACDSHSTEKGTKIPGVFQQEGCCQLNMCVASSASTLKCYQTNFDRPTSEADFNNNVFVKSSIIEFQ